MRIRTVKPEFFRDEKLSDLEVSFPGLRPMLVFCGLWGVCDNQGVFPWSERILKLDILPLVPFDFGKTLEILERAGMLRRFSKDGKVYGHVINFTKHQRITGKEAQDGAKYPISTEYLPVQGNNGETPGKQRGSNRETPGKHLGAQEGKGKEGKGKDIAADFPDASPVLPSGSASRGSSEPPSSEADLALYHSAEASFLSKNDQRFTDYPKEGSALKGIVKKAKARAPDDPGPFLEQMLGAFWKLIKGNDKFWKGQPFLPSTLNSSAIWDRVLSTLRNGQKIASASSLAIASGRDPEGDPFES